MKREKLGKILIRIGRISLLLGLGAVGGSYATYQGVDWLPTMLEIILGIFIIGLVSIIIGHFLDDSAFDKLSTTRRLRKRIFIYLLVAILFTIGRLVLYWKKSSPLIDLTKTQYNTAFNLDSQRYIELDNGIEKTLAFLEDQKGLNDSDRMLSYQQEQQILDAWSILIDQAFALDQIRIFYEDWYLFDARVQYSFHLRSFLLTFASELSLIEKSSRLIQLLSVNKNVVKFLDSPHPLLQIPANSYSKFRQEFHGIRDQARLVAGQQYLKWLDSVLDGKEESRGLGCLWLWNRIEIHLTKLSAFSGVEGSTLVVGSDLQAIKRGFRHSWYAVQSSVAEWMGDTKVRRIDTYLINRTQQQEFDKLLQPGDILLSRKNWYLSNVGLPGFWPHAILYIGDQKKFTDFFNDPKIQTLVESVSGQRRSLGEYLEIQSPSKWLQYQLGEQDEPYKVIEAISEGVVFSTLAHSAGDYLVALRPKLSKLKKAKAIIQAFNHLGKPYDFDFDFATDHSLVCTELVWRSYRRENDADEGLEIPLVDVLGRKTLPANEIARIFTKEHAQDSAQLDFVFFMDANEKERKAYKSNQQEFLKTHLRTKWDIALR